jgi:hypothetical protein
MFNIHLRSTLHKFTYEPFLSALSVLNAAKIKHLEIVLWGDYNEDDGDTVSFGNHDFGIALRNLIYAPKLVVCIDIVTTNAKAQQEDSSHSSSNFCAFDWLMAAFADEWYFHKTCFDLFRAVARFHMTRMFLEPTIHTCKSRWFSEARADPGLRHHERRRLWELEERYGLAHEEDEERPSGSEDEDVRSSKDDEYGDSDKEDDKEMEIDEKKRARTRITEEMGNSMKAQRDEDEEGGKRDESGMDVESDHNNDGHDRSSA